MQPYEISRGRILSSTDLSTLYVFLAQHVSDCVKINIIDFIFHFFLNSKIAWQALYATATRAKRCRLEMSKLPFSANVPKFQNSQGLWKKHIGFSIITFCAGRLFFSFFSETKRLYSTKLYIANALYSRIKKIGIQSNFCYACVCYFSGTELNQSKRLDLTRWVGNMCFKLKTIHNWVIWI